MSVRNHLNLEVESLVSPQFAWTEDALAIVTFLQQTRPPPNGMYFHLYRDPGCTANLDYISLSNSFRDLGIVNDQVIYAKMESRIPYE